LVGGPLWVDCVEQLLPGAGIQLDCDTIGSMAKYDPHGDDLQRFLDELCSDWGFCSLGQLHRNSIVPVNNAFPEDEAGISALALEILRAEGFERPESEKTWLRRLSDRIRQVRAR
jgi:hypothetical protein